MKQLLSSINLSIISIGISTVFYIVSLTPIFMPSMTMYYISYVVTIIQSILVIWALSVGVKEKNTSGIVLAILLSIMYYKPLMDSMTSLVNTLVAITLF